MPDREVTLDSCRYEYADGGILILTGWTVFDKTDIEFQAKAGDTRLQLVSKHYPRPDVVSACPDLFHETEGEIGELCPGFEIRIPGIAGVIPSGDPVLVRLVCKGKNYRIARITSSEMREGLAADSLRYLIEKTEKRGDDVWIRGWYISRTGNAELCVLGDGRVPVPGAEPVYHRRTDLSEVFDLDLSCCYGFEISFPRSCVEGKKVVLQFKNAFASLEYELNLCTFDVQNTRIGRVAGYLCSDRGKESFRILRERGFFYLMGFLEEKSRSSYEHYDFYQKQTAVSRRELEKQKRKNLSPAPLFSMIVPVGQEGENLSRLMASAENQSYGNWEMLLVKEGGLDTGSPDSIKDRRICSVITQKASFAERMTDAVNASKGDYIIFSSQDSLFAPDMLYRHIAVLHPHPETDLIYGDTDHYHCFRSGLDLPGLSREKTVFTEPHFKPDPDPVFLQSRNYIGLPFMVSRSLFYSQEPLEGDFTSIEDYGYGLLRQCFSATDRIRHIPGVLCHRAVQEPEAPEIGETPGQRAEVCTAASISGNPCVSILIPNKDHIEDLSKCIDSILTKSTWRNIEIIIIENNSTESETEEYYSKITEDPRVRTVRYHGEFNYSRINNFGSAAASGEYLILLNNDTEVISPGWIESMLMYCTEEGTGIAGARLLYPDDTLQHAGIVVGIGGTAGHLYLGKPMDFTGPLFESVSARRVSAVTGACMMVKTSVYRKIGGLDPDFAVAFNDVDFCLRAAAEGEHTVYVPSAILYHYESKSRGYETTPEKAARFAAESALFRQRHSGFLAAGDPYYNPNLTLSGTDGSERDVYHGKEEA